MPTCLIVVEWEKLTGQQPGVQVNGPPVLSEYVVPTKDDNTMGVFCCYMTDESISQFVQYEIGTLVDAAVVAHGVGYP